jgi:hypothetical protein
MDVLVRFQPAITWQISTKNGSSTSVTANGAVINAQHLQVAVKQVSNVNDKCGKPQPGEMLYDNLTFATAKSSVWEYEIQAGGVPHDDEVPTGNKTLGCNSFVGGKLVAPQGGHASQQADDDSAATSLLTHIRSIGPFMALSMALTSLITL